MQIDTEKLKQLVIDTAKQSKIAPQVKDVVVIPDEDAEGDAFLRVEIQVQNTSEEDDADFEELLEAIESAVGAVDERYPSVRFLDAA